MAEQDPAIESLFAEVDDLLAREQPSQALKLLRRDTPPRPGADLLDAREEAAQWRQRLIFCEGFHDRLGQCYWAISQGKPINECGELSFIGSRGEQLSWHLLAGKHWLLSPQDDPARNQARALVLEEYATAPWNLFQHLGFPELPFDKFESPVVRARLRHLRNLMAEAGYDENQLFGLLDPARPARPPTIFRRVVQGIMVTGCFGLIGLAILGFVLCAVMGAQWLFSLWK